MASRRRLRRLALVTAVVGTLAVAAVLGSLVATIESGRDVRGSETDEFVVTDIPDPEPPRPEPTPPGEDPGGKQVVSWPTYGYGPQRTRISPYEHRPPFTRRWMFRARNLLEFPPAIAYGNLYFSNIDGFTWAVDAETGQAVWRKRSMRCTASTPAVADGLVVQAFLNERPCNSSRSPFDLDGEVVAFDAKTGNVRWRAGLGPTESSPLVVGRRVIVGDWRGDVVAFDLGTGRRLWSYRTGGRVKGAVSASGQTVFAGSYDGRVVALDVRTGGLLWRSSSQGRFGGRGRFYSTPAIAYGRVFIGSTDGKVYAFGASSGRLLWSSSTGGYVYSSPAVWQKTVFVGSYSRRLYALDAATGAVRWTVSANGPISGSPTVMAGLVWFATLSGRTYVVDARTGREVWSFPDGEYTPVVADADRAYLVGHTRIYALDPQG